MCLKAHHQLQYAKDAPCAASNRCCRCRCRRNRIGKAACHDAHPPTRASPFETRYQVAGDGVRSSALHTVPHPSIATSFPSTRPCLPLRGAREHGSARPPGRAGSRLRVRNVNIRLGCDNKPRRNTDSQELTPLAWPMVCSESAASTLGPGTAAPLARGSAILYLVYAIVVSDAIRFVNIGPDRYFSPCHLHIRSRSTMYAR